MAESLDLLNEEITRFGSATEPFYGDIKDVLLPELSGTVPHARARKRAIFCLGECCAAGCGQRLGS